MDEAQSVELMLRSALPIDDVDQLFIGSNDGFAVVWIDISERPDLAQLAEKVRTQVGYSILTWFYVSPGKHHMVIGLRIDQRKPSRYVIHLAFKVAQYVDQLATIGKYGKVWIVPGPPPTHLVGTTVMDAKDFIKKVLDYSGQGLFISLQEHLVEELRARLVEWRRIK